MELSALKFYFIPGLFTLSLDLSKCVDLKKPLWYFAEDNRIVGLYFSIFVMKENILRVLLSLFIVITFFTVYRNSSQNYSEKLTDGLSLFSVKSDMPADEDRTGRGKKRRKASMSFKTALGLSANNLLTKKARTILIAIAGSIGIIGIALIQALDYNSGAAKYKLLTTSDNMIVFLPFEEFCERGKNITCFTLYCKTSDKDKVYAAYEQAGLEVTEYKDVVGVTHNDFLIQIISGLIYLLAVLLYTVHNAKKSVLLRMDGFSVADITARECVKVLPYGVIAFLICFVLSALYIGLNVRLSVTEYFVSGLGTYRNALSILILAVIIRIVFTFLFCKEKYIKGAFPGKMMYFLISTVKTLAIALLTLSITSFVLDVFIPDVVAYMSLNKNSDKIEGLVYFTQIKGGVEQSDLSESQFAPKLMDFYHDAVIDYDAIVCDTYDYLLDDNGIPLYTDNAKAGFGPSIEVNNNYLKENEVYDLEGNRIYEESLEPDCLTILIPDDYQWDEQLLVRYDGIDYYPDLKVVFKEYDSQRSRLYVYLIGGMGSNQGILSPAPAIKVVNDYSLENDWHFKYDLLLNILYGRTMFRTHTDNPSAELEPLIKKYDCQDIIDGIVPLETELNKRIEDSWKGVLSSLLILSSLIFVTAVTTSFATDFYCRNQRHLIAARALSGYSFTGTFRFHVLVLCLEYTAVFIAGVAAAFNTGKVWVPLTVTLIIVISDLITNILRCRMQLKKNVYQISKGEM